MYHGPHSENSSFSYLSGIPGLSSGDSRSSAGLLTGQSNNSGGLDSHRSNLAIVISNCNKDSRHGPFVSESAVVFQQNDITFCEVSFLSCHLCLSCTLLHLFQNVLVSSHLCLGCRLCKYSLLHLF